MSRIGKLPIVIPNAVTVTTDADGQVSVTGPKGALSCRVSPMMRLAQSDGTLVVERPSDGKEHRSLHGLTRSLVFNMVEGVTKGFEKQLEIQGVGYRAQMSGAGIEINVGFSHIVEVAPRDGIAFAVAVDPQTRNSVITVSGIDKQRVGQTAADIRRIRKPEPYKGKGIRYKGEIVKLKAGKSSVKGATK